MHFGRRIAVLLASAAAVRASGCGSKTTSLKTNSRTEVTLQNSNNRTYIHWLPHGYDGSKPTPLILSFHGAGATAAQQADVDHLTTSDFNTDHIVVYLQSTEIDKQYLWEVSPGVHVDDVTYAMDVLDTIENDFCIDGSRIYATGMSQGGGMVNLLACNETTTNRFAAFSTVSGAFYYPETDGKCNPDNVTFTCKPGRKHVPLLAFQGGDDPVVSYKGGSRRGGCLPDVGHWISQWAVREGLSAEPTDKQAITGAATKYIYGDGNNKGLVSLVYDGKSVGHVWPATGKYGFKSTASFNASSLIMDFFKRQQLPVQHGSSGTSTGSSSPTSTSSPKPSDTKGSASTSRVFHVAKLSGLSLLYAIFA